MTMVIDTNSINSSALGKPRSDASGSATSDKNAATGQLAETKATSSSSADTFELSAQAQNLNSIQQSLQNLPEIDDAKVSAIKQSINDGSYSINIEALADKIIADDQNFFV